jgi:diketogulonate reductase-like aldo/keto reductase
MSNHAQGFSPLPKSTTISRIEENADLYDFELTEEDMKLLDTGKYEPCSWDPTVNRD